MSTTTLADITTELYGPGEHLSLCTLAPGGTFHAAVLPAPHIPDPLPQDRNVWFSINPVPADVIGRGAATDVTRWAALYADLDVKPGALPTLEAAHAVVTTLATMAGTQPTFLIASGHGLQPIWQIDPEDPAADTTDPARRGDVEALLRRWGRLVGRVASDHGATTVDSVFDLPRILRAPATINHKAAPVPATATATGGHPLTVAEVVELLDAYGVEELPEDRRDLGAVIAPPAEWEHGERTCRFVAAMVDGWATDTPTARHPWLVGQAVRLAAAHRAGCITEHDHQAAWAALTTRFRWLLAHAAPARDEAPREAQDAAAWGVRRAAAMTDTEVAANLGKHAHHDDLDGLMAPTNLTTLPAPTAPTESTPVDDQAETAAEPAPGSSWAAVDIADTITGLLAGTITRHAPTIGARDDDTCLFYAGKVNGIAGASGSGKTWTALYAVAQQLAAGHHVVYVDLEDDAAGIVGRLLDLGAHPDTLHKGFHYVHPEESFGTEAARHLAALIRAHRPTLVIIDSTGESMALDGAKPNDDDDTARWFRRLPTAVANTGPAVVVLDHVVKADDGGLWPIGSQRKRAAINGAQYMQITVRPFAKGQPGAAKLVCAKDRHGNYRTGQRVAELTVTPDGDGVHLTLRAPSDATTPAAETLRPTALMEKVSRALEAAGEPLSGRAIDQRVPGKREHIIHALDVLTAEGHVLRTSGARRSVLHTVHLPYRQADDPRSDTYTGPTTTVSVSGSPSLEGEGGTTHSTTSGNHSGTTREPLEEPLDIAENHGNHSREPQAPSESSGSPVVPAPNTTPCTVCDTPIGDRRDAAGYTTCAAHYRQEPAA